MKQQPAVAGDGGPSLLDRVFGSLSHSRRRGAIYYLREEGQADLSAVATAVAAWEMNVDPDDVSDETRRRVTVDLRHVHLPKLDDYGLVDFDPRSNTITYDYPPGVLSELVELAAAIERPP